MDIGLSHLEEMALPMELSTIPVASKPCDLPHKHHKFVKEELMNLLEEGVIERALSSYAVPIIVVPHKAPPGCLLTETKRLVIDTCELTSNSLKSKLFRLSLKAAIC